MRQPPDVPPLKRHCYGLPPGAPCPSPEDCECFREGSMSMRDRAEQFFAYAFILVATFIVITGVWMLMEKAFGADNEPPCLTKQAARAKYPGKYLYWHTADHCWNASPGRRHSPTPHPKPAPKPQNEPDGSVAPAKAVAQAGPTVAYPALMTGSGTTPDMLDPNAMTRWPLVYDLDVPPPQFVPWNDRINLSQQVVPLFRPIKPSPSR